MQASNQKKLEKSNKLANVCYDIRGPVLQRARQMEEEGQRIINRAVDLKPRRQTLLRAADEACGVLQRQQIRPRRR